MTAIRNFPVLKFEPAIPALPFNIRKINWAPEQGLELEEQPHSHDYFEIIWVTQGAGTHWIDLQQFPIEANQVFCVQPGQMHRFIADHHAEVVTLSFTNSFLGLNESAFDLNAETSLLQQFSKAGAIKIATPLLADVHEVMERLMKEFNSCYSFKTEILKRYLKIFFLYLSRQLETNAEPVVQTRNMELVLHFRTLLDKNFKQQKMVAAYAGQLFVTPNYLNEIVKKSTGCSAGHHIRQRVVLEAKRMAMQSNSNMKQIAYELGFSDSGHFSKFFKTVTSKNFSEFKRETNVALSFG